MLLVKEVVHMATYKPKSRYSFELSDTEYDNITKRLNGYVSKRREHKLIQAGEKMSQASKKYQIEIR